MKDKFLYFYYFALILMLALYTNMSHSPNMVVRLSYLAALVLPLVKRVELFPAVIICALGISKNTFAYPLMPTDLYYYVILSLVFAILALNRRGFHTDINPLFVIAIIFVLLNDIILQETPSQMVTVFFIFIAFYFCIDTISEVDTQNFSLSFMLISLTIGSWILFVPEAQVNSYNTVEEMEQTGWTDPNYLGAALGTGLVVAVKDLLEGNKKPYYIIISILTVILTTFAMLQLASRGAFLAVVLAIVILFISSKRKGWYKIVVVGLAVLFVWLLYSNQYMEFVLARFEADDGTGSNRTVYWFSKLDAFFNIKNPLNWIFGIGHSGGVELGEGFGGGHSTHNDFVSALIYYGFVGLILFFCAIMYPLRICQKSDRPQIFALLVYLLTCSMTIEPLARGNFVYWGFFFYIIVLARQSQAMELVEEEEDEDEVQD